MNVKLLPGNQLTNLLRQTHSSALLISPFIKYKALRQLLSAISNGVELQVVTRWRVDEILAGVSDLDVYSLLQERGSTLWLCSTLHAKYYRGDETVLVGSANITAKALGWASTPNLEILANTTPVTAFEEQVYANAVQVDDELYKLFKTNIEAIPPLPKPDLELPTDIQEESLDDGGAVISLDQWLPTLRYPEHLYVAYCGDLDKLTSAARESALVDLSVLDIPPGLSEDIFKKTVGTLLLQMPLINKVDQLVATSQRFGAVRNYLKQQVKRDNFDATTAWQTLMRWLLYFLSDVYQAYKPKHSEIFTRKY